MSEITLDLNKQAYYKGVFYARCLTPRVMGAQIVLTPVRGISTLQQFVRPHHTVKHGFVFKAPPHIKDITARMFSACGSIIRFVECNELHRK